MRHAGLRRRAPRGNRLRRLPRAAPHARPRHLRRRRGRLRLQLHASVRPHPATRCGSRSKPAPPTRRPASCRSVGSGRVRRPRDRSPKVGGLTATTTSRRIVVVTGEVLGPQMAGPAIRAVADRRALATEHAVDLVTTNRSASLASRRRRRATSSRTTLEALAAWCDVVVVQGDALRGPRACSDVDAVVVVDLYDPFHLESSSRRAHLDPDHAPARRSERRSTSSTSRSGAVTSSSARARISATSGSATSRRAGRVNELTLRRRPRRSRR